jgi:aminomethyltransferase
LTTKNVPLNDTHAAMGAKMIPFAGFLMPVRYSSDLDEHHAVRNSVGIFDVSHMGQFVIKGAKAIDLLQFITSNDVSVLIDGQAQYSCLPNTTGGIIDDIIVYRYQADFYYVVVNASNINKDWAWFEKNNQQFGAEIANISDETCLFAVQGPKAMETLQLLTDYDLKTIPYYHFAKAKFMDLEDVIIANTGYTGAGGFEIFIPNAAAEKVWNKIITIGKPFGLKPIGLGARDTLRLEMGYCLYGNDIDDTTSPLEAGLGWITKFTKTFTNSDALLKQKQNGVSKKLIGFKMIDRGIPRSHYEIVDEQGNTIGEVSSGTQSPTLGYGVGMGYIKTSFTALGTPIFIKVREKLLKAEVVKFPFLPKTSL